MIRHAFSWVCFIKRVRGLEYDADLARLRMDLEESAKFVRS